MFEPLHPRDFCAYWIPKIFGLKPGDYGYRKACLLLLSRLTDSPEPTCANWIDYDKSDEKSPKPEKRAIYSPLHPPRIPESKKKSIYTPLHLQKFLRAVHILWNIEESFPLTLLSLKRELLDD